MCLVGKVRIQHVRVLLGSSTYKRGIRFRKEISLNGFLLVHYAINCIVLQLVLNNFLFFFHQQVQ